MDSTTPKTKATPEGQGLLKNNESGGEATKPGELGVVSTEEITTKCGIRGFAPKCLQPCADVRAYAANTSALLLLQIAVFTYLVGVGRTMERRFGLSSTEVNLPGSISDLLSTCVGLFIGYLGHKLHKPRVLAVSNLIVSIAVLLFVLPFFIYGPKDLTTSSVPTAFYNETSLSSYGAQGLCQLSENTTDTSGSCDETQGNAGDISLRMVKQGALACLVAGAVLLGIGTPAVSTLSLPYLDENCSHEDSAFYVGIVTSMYALSPILGFLLAAVCTRIPEDLVGSPDIPPSDPRFIGAWWIGLLVYGLPIVILSCPIAFFPKHLKYYYIDNNKTKKPKGKRLKKFNAGKEIKDFPKQLWSLLSNLPYLLLVFSKVCGLYVVTGIFLQQPRYIEIHFGQPAYMANIISGASGAIVGAVGNVLGGFLMKKFKFGTVGSARMCVYAMVVGVLSTGTAMLLACPQIPINGTLQPTGSLDVSETCNAGCGCDASLRPVCVNETVNYITPCHAGCTTFNQQNMTFSDCTCAGPEVTVRPGYCGSVACGMIIPYILVGILGSFLASIGRVPATMLMFRIVKKEEKAFAIGILSFALNLLCFVPSPIMFGRLFDSACRLWEMRCNTRGACLIYDISKFRYFMHGVTLLFQVLSLLFGIAVLVLVTKQESKKKPDKDNNQNTETEALK